MLIVDSVKLLKIMIERGLSYRDLSRTCGIQENYLAKIIRNGGSIRIKTLSKLANALNLDYNYLLKEEL